MKFLFLLLFLLSACEGPEFIPAPSEPEPTPILNAPVAKEKSPMVEAGMMDAGPMPAPMQDLTAAPTTPVCVNDLSKIGAGDFSISFTLQTTMVGVSAILNQRQICAGSDFWDIQAAFPSPTQSNQPNGAFGYSMFGIGMETDDTQNYTDLVASVVLNDGAPHAIQFLRLSGNLSIIVDGKTLISKPSLSAFNMLQPLVQGKDVCDSVDGTLPFTSGAITNLCLEKL